MFDIHLTDEVVPDSDGQGVYGRIQIEEYVETFIASLVCWPSAKYEQHWRQGCQRLVDGMSESVLISSCVEPSMSDFLVWWPLYRDGQVVHVRNEILAYSELIKPFSIDDRWPFIRPRKIRTNEGFEISEWDTRIESIQEFLNRKQVN